MGLNREQKGSREVVDICNAGVVSSVVGCVESQPHGAKEEPGGDVEAAEEENDEVPTGVDYGGEEVPEESQAVVGRDVEMLD